MIYARFYNVYFGEGSLVHCEWDTSLVFDVHCYKDCSTVFVGTKINTCLLKSLFEDRVMI